MEIHPGTHEVFLISEVDKECQLSQINWKKKKVVVLRKRLQIWSLQLVPSRKAFEEISDAKEKSVSFKKGYEEQNVSTSRRQTYMLSVQVGAEPSDKLL